MTFRKDENAKPCSRCKSSACAVAYWDALSRDPKLMDVLSPGQRRRKIEKNLTNAQNECDRERMARVNEHAFTHGQMVVVRQRVANKLIIAKEVTETLIVGVIKGFGSAGVAQIVSKTGQSFSCSILDLEAYDVPQE